MSGCAMISRMFFSLVLPPAVRRSLPRRASQTAQLYRHVAIALVKQGPALALNVPRFLPIVGPAAAGVGIDCLLYTSRCV